MGVLNQVGEVMGKIIPTDICERFHVLSNNRVVAMLTFLSIEVSSLSLQAMRVSCSTSSTKG
jgi:hypothetical protein